MALLPELPVPPHNGVWIVRQLSRRPQPHVIARLMYLRILQIDRIEREMLNRPIGRRQNAIGVALHQYGGE